MTRYTLVTLGIKPNREVSLLDKAPQPSLDYAFQNQAWTLTSKFSVVKY